MDEALHLLSRILRKKSSLIGRFKRWLLVLLWRLQSAKVEAFWQLCTARSMFGQLNNACRAVPAEVA